MARPRLEILAKRAGSRVSVTPLVSQSRRAAQFEFRSATASVTLTFSVVPDREIENAVLEYDLRIIPVLWKFDAHGEFRAAIATPDLDGARRWLDDRIVAFVELYIQINESELVNEAERVEDPVAKIQFPKFAAGATLDHGGQTYFFIDNDTKAEFARQHGIVATR
jgi:YHS domain-containing protein